MQNIPPSMYFAVTLVAIGAFAVSLNAQDRERQPAIAALEANLQDERAMFTARVDRQVDDDLLETGRLVAMGGSEAGGSGMACITCHGAEGQGDGSGAFPRLAGMSGWYMYKQLVDYASGDRPNQVMTGVAQRLTEYEMARVSEKLAEHLNALAGPCAVIMPMGGLSHHDRPGGMIEDPALRATCRDTLRAQLGAHIQLIESDAHLFDPAITQAVLTTLDELTAGKV